MNNTAFEKTYINGQSAKPEGFNRVEFATKSLILQINKTQRTYQQAAKEISTFSNDEYWYAVLGDLFSDKNYNAKNNNADFLDHLKNAEQQLGLSAAKTKRNLSLKYNGQLYASIAYSITAIIAACIAGYIAIQFGASNAQSLPLLLGCGVLSLITSAQAIRMLQKYHYNKSKKDSAIEKAINFQTNQFKNFNEAEKFILRRIENFLNASAAND